MDVMDQAYVTYSGDLFCQRCGSRYDAEDDQEWWDDGILIYGPDERDGGEAPKE